MLAGFSPSMAAQEVCCARASLLWLDRRFHQHLGDDRPEGGADDSPLPAGTGRDRAYRQSQKYLEASGNREGLKVQFKPEAWRLRPNRSSATVAGAVMPTGVAPRLTRLGSEA